MKIIFYFSMILAIYSCDEHKKEKKLESFNSTIEKNNNQKNQTHSDFVQFTKEFPPIEFPIEVKIRNKFLRSRPDEIKRELAFLFICHEDSNCIVDSLPATGFLRFYYGWQYPKNSKIVLLSYLSNSFWGSKWYLGSFTKGGEILSKIIISEEVNDKIITNGYIDENFVISTAEITYRPTENKIVGKETKREYFLDTLGIFRKRFEKHLKEKEYRYDENGNLF